MHVAAIVWSSGWLGVGRWGWVSHNSLEPLNCGVSVAESELLKQRGAPVKVWECCLKPHKFLYCLELLNFSGFGGVESSEQMCP